MDAKAALPYIAAMRLLLLLSALLAALSGVGGTRAGAQPVQASAALLTAPVQVAAATQIAHRFVTAAYAGPPPRLPAPRLSGTVAPRALYAERRRE